MPKIKAPTYHIVEYVFDQLRLYTTPKEDYVENQKELLSLPWVRVYQKHKQFARFTISDQDTFKYLMIEDTNCNWWWIVAILPLDFPCTFPKFKSIKDKTITDEEPTEDLQEVPKPKSRKKK